MTYPQEYIDTLLSRVDIVEVVRSFLLMRRTAGGDYVGLCPFHNEQTPSFKVLATKQFYHCHGGCGATGSAIKFLIENQQMTFQSAVMYLARRYRFYPKEWERKRLRAEKRKRR